MAGLQDYIRGVSEQMAAAANPWSDAGQAHEAGGQDPWTAGAPGSFTQYAAASAGRDPWTSLSGNGGPADGDPWGAIAGISTRNPGDKGLSAWAQALTSPTNTSGAHGAPPPAGANEIADYIRQAATARGEDPDVALQVEGSEGGLDPAKWEGDNGSSYGPYQLHWANRATGGNAVAGLGDAFTQATGFQYGDPASWKANIDYALDQAATGGWGPWHGAQALGLDNRAGLTGAHALGSYAGATPLPADNMGVLAKAQPYLGQAYSWGGKNTADHPGFDCSGFAGYLEGTGMPESTVSLYGKSQGIDASTAQPGDLVFYNMNQSDMHQQHVAVYLGNGKIVQAGGTQNNINIGDAAQLGQAGEFRRIVK